VWGIGCYATEPAAQRRETWRGLKLLREILTEIKEELISDELTESEIETGREDEHIKIVKMFYSGPYPHSGGGNRYICVIVDSYSTYCWLYPTSNEMADTAVKCLLKDSSKIGAFKNLVTDRAAAFLGGVMTSFCELFGITKISTTSFSPRSNTRVERLQRKLIECLKDSYVQGRPWETSLIFVEKALRSSPIKGIGVSPFEIVK